MLRSPSTKTKCERDYTTLQSINLHNKQGSHSHGKSWKKLLSWKVMEKAWNMKISQNFMEKSWNCLFSWLWQLSSLWLSCMLWDTIITISETVWEWESWKEANQSWKSHGILFSDFCGNPDKLKLLFWILWTPVGGAVVIDPSTVFGSEQISKIWAYTVHTWNTLKLFVFWKMVLKQTSIYYFL